MAAGRVLIIEGDLGDRREMVTGLSSAGFEVYACKDGVAAIHELEHSHGVGNHFDYIVTDAALPDISGMKILKVLKTDYPDLPMVVVSAGDTEAASRETHEYDNTGFVPKPVMIDSLVSALEQLQPGQTTEQHTHLGKPVATGTENKAFVQGICSGDSAAIIASLRAIHGVTRAEAISETSGIMVAIWRSTAENLTATLAEVSAVDGFEVNVISHVAKVRLDKDVSHFIGDYNHALELTQPPDLLPEGPFGYLLIEVDPAYVQDIYTMVYFMDEVLECEVTDGGNRILAYACETDSDEHARHLERLKLRSDIISVTDLLTVA